MTPKTLQPLWTACHSSLQLDRLQRGELSENDAKALRGHLADCSKCSDAVEELSLAQSEILPPLRALTAKPPLLKLVRDEPAGLGVGGWGLGTDRESPKPPLPTPNTERPTPKRSAWAKSFSLVTGLAAAAAAILVLRPATGERTKGSQQFSLGMYVQHGDSVRRAGPGDSVHPGDAVRFSIRAPADGFAAVLSRDSQGHASIYFPAGSRAAAVDAGQSPHSEVALPLGTRLDETLGQEQLLGIFCSSAVELEPIRLGLEQAKPGIPEGCQTAQWSFEKR